MLIEERKLIGPGVEVIDGTENLIGKLPERLGEEGDLTGLKFKSKRRSNK